MNAAAVIGFDCEAIQNIEFVCIGFFAATSSKPTASTSSTLSGSATSTTAPASALLSTYGCKTGASFLEGATACKGLTASRRNVSRRVLFMGMGMREGTG